MTKPTMQDIPVDLPEIRYTEGGDLDVPSVYERLAALDRALSSGLMAPRVHEALVRSSQTILRDYRLATTKEANLRKMRAVYDGMKALSGDAAKKARAVKAGRAPITDEED